MKNLQLHLNPKNITPTFRQSVFWSTVAYSKSYELLHMQLWRKGRVALEDTTITINNQEYGVVKFYDIKSSSKNPYNKDSYNDLGLNQLFVGQDPNKPYNGDPGSRSGIYHDDCKIIPKINFDPDSKFWSVFGRKDDKNELLDDIPLSVPMSGWQWGIDGWNAFANEYLAYHKIREYDKWGTKLIESVEQIDITDNNNNIEHRYARVTHADGSIEDIEIPPVTYQTIIGNPTTILPKLERKTVLTQRTSIINIGARRQNVTYTEGYVPIQMYIDRFGEPLKIIEEQAYTNAISGSAEGRLYIFPGGIVFFFSPPVYREFYENRYTLTPLPYPVDDDSKIPEAGYIKTFITNNGTRQFRVLINKKTGRTLASKIVFIDYWDSIFELYVHENAEWWQIVVAIVVIIVACIITFYFPPFGIAAQSGVAAVLAMGVFIGGIGALSGNKWFQAIGAVMTLGASIYGGTQAAAQVAASAAAQSAATTAAASAAAKVTITAMLQYAFTEMPVQTFLTLFNLYKTLTTQEIQTKQSIEEDKSPKVQFMVKYEEEVDEVMKIGRAHEDILEFAKI